MDVVKTVRQRRSKKMDDMPGLSLRTLALSLFLLSSFGFGGCDDLDDILSPHERDNPDDPEAEPPQPPEITELSINGRSDDIFIENNHQLSIDWDFEYDERYDETFGGAPPMNFEVVIIFDQVDENHPVDEVIFHQDDISSAERRIELYNDGEFTLEITPHYDTQRELSGDTFRQSFTMDVMEPGSLTFLRNRIHKTSGEEFFVDIWGKELDGFFAGEFDVEFDHDLLELKGVNHSGSLFQNFEYSLAERHDVSQLVAPDFNKTDVLNEANDNGQAEISTTLIHPSEEELVEVTGTGSLIRLYFEVRSGAATGSEAVISIAEEDVLLLNAGEEEIDYLVKEEAVISIN